MKEMFSFIFIIIIVVLLLFGSWFGYLYLLRPALGLKREAIQHSQQYVESKQSMLMQLASEYNSTDNSGQKVVLLERMKMEAERIPYDQVPESVKKILRSEG